MVLVSKRTQHGCTDCHARPGEHHAANCPRFSQSSSVAELSKRAAAGENIDVPVTVKVNRVSRPTMDGGGLRFSLGKCKIDLVPPEWVWALAMVLTRGAAKYASRNWEKGMRWSEVVGPMFRHAFKWICGERYDAETGCHHLAMVAWNALVLMTYDIREIGENDLVGDMRWLDLVTMEPGPELQKIIDKKMAESKKAA